MRSWKEILAVSGVTIPAGIGIICANYTGDPETSGLAGQLAGAAVLDVGLFYLSLFGLGNLAERRKRKYAMMDDWELRD